ncbi:transglutaminase [Leptospira bourretii]|uniref:Transglutaminase n=1 Tax=Leptospira bourretii TaxID=2484962 RepID=A0A4R9IRB4_9LEPT|nr:7TM domain-containing protein [Leptospira bourretii]TGK85645.1 transglutaminase [Leptospira bourretii]TGK94541.1 transglutaminase [Leptospira bourretii]TGL24897.1 transglutaminase [Leptospira bourretii]TGL37089.1 transglutaminase [Leptospira bourretii]
MDRKTLITVSILIILPIVSILYKLKVADLSLLPMEVDDTVNLQVVILPKENVAVSEVNFPVPKQFIQSKVLKSNMKIEDLDFRMQKRQYGHLGIWEGEDWNSPIGYYAKIKILPYTHSHPEPEIPQTTGKQSAKEPYYLSLKNFSPEEIQLAKKLFEQIHPYDKDNVAAAKQIFYFISEEVLNTTKEISLSDTIRLHNGSAYTQAILFSLLCRIRGIQARTVAGFDLSKQNTKDNKTKLSFWNEIRIHGKWYFVSTYKNIFASAVNGYLPLWKSVEERRSLGEEPATFRYTTYITKSNVNRYNFKEYSDEIATSNRFLRYYSLYSLPTPLQNLFRLVILIPIGALVLSVARNMIGIPTFGIFTPILLAMFFYETNLLFGICFFLLIIGLGFFERYALDKYYLLAVPRLSILLTITVITLILFSVLNEEISIFNQMSVTLFPIVITTIFVERFSIMIIEEGVLHTFVTLAGTLLIALISYMIFFFGSLQILFFTHPELLFIVIAIQILLGQYKGYRVSELFRFKEIFKS